MRLTVREAASYLHVDEATVRSWIKKRGLPAHRMDERLHLNAVELWQWATEQGIPVSRRLLDHARREVRNPANPVVGERERDAFGLHQRDVLLDERAPGLRQDPHELVAAERLELDANRKSSL